MATLGYKHIEKQFEVKVEARKGKPVVDKRGMVAITPPYRHCNRIDIEILKQKFEKVVA